MLFKRFKFYRDEEGNLQLIFTLFLLIFIGISGLVIDAGILYKTKGELRRTANAAVLSGAQELTNSDSAVTTVVQDILKADKEEESFKELIIKPNGENKLKITLEKNVPLHFMKVFKMNSVTINASATAEIIPMISTTGAVPLGIDNSVDLKPYPEEYRLKVDSGDSTIGNFGVLALSGVGSNLYEQDLMYGYDAKLEKGDVIQTQTGNMEGKTRNGVNYRIDSSPYTVYDPANRDDPRIIKILIYEPEVIQQGQLVSVRIVGFAYFYLKAPMRPQDSEITGFFIKRVGTGKGDANAEDNGAYVIRLIE